MGAFYRQYKAKGFEALFAAVDPNPPVAAFVQRYQLPFPVGMALDAKAREYMMHTMVRPAYVPWLVFIDKKGVIRAQFTGVDAIFNQGTAGLAREVDKLLAEPGGPAAPAKKSTPKKK
ncbi:MAG: TlpA family protein disulfide reductase [Bryobacterales bacterium]|nr:TlpA family protein disulfide reductase [Bryobacterales bacterium]